MACDASRVTTDADDAPAASSRRNVSTDAASLSSTTTLRGAAFAPRTAAASTVTPVVAVAAAVTAVAASPVVETFFMLPASSRTNKPEQPGHSIVRERLFSMSGYWRTRQHTKHTRVSTITTPTLTLTLQHSAPLSSMVQPCSNLRDMFATPSSVFRATS